MKQAHKWTKQALEKKFRIKNQVLIAMYRYGWERNKLYITQDYMIFAPRLYGKVQIVALTHSHYTISRLKGISTDFTTGIKLTIETPSGIEQVKELTRLCKRSKSPKVLDDTATSNKQEMALRVMYEFHVLLAHLWHQTRIEEDSKMYPCVCVQRPTLFDVSKGRAGLAYTILGGSSSLHRVLVLSDSSSHSTPGEYYMDIHEKQLLFITGKSSSSSFVDKRPHITLDMSRLSSVQVAARPLTLLLTFENRQIEVLCYRYGHAILDLKLSSIQNANRVLSWQPGHELWVAPEHKVFIETKIQNYKNQNFLGSPPSPFNHKRRLSSFLTDAIITPPLFASDDNPLLLAASRKSATRASLKRTNSTGSIQTTSPLLDIVSKEEVPVGSLLTAQRLKQVLVGSRVNQIYVSTDSSSYTDSEDSFGTPSSFQLRERSLSDDLKEVTISINST